MDLQEKHRRSRKKSNKKSNKSERLKKSSGRTFTNREFNFFSILLNVYKLDVYT